jgi:ankyrin repeat protein
LLAELYLKSIAKCRTVTAVRKAIEDLPSGSDAYAQVYSNTMARIKHRETANLALDILCWVAWARQPLTIREIQHALALREGSVILDEDNTVNTDDIVSVCEGLVILDTETNIVRLIHYTTKEYLERVRHTWFPDVDAQILGDCLRLLSNPIFDSGQCWTDPDLTARLRTFPLYDYAARNWGHHARDTTAMDAEVLSLLRDTNKVDAAGQCLSLHVYEGRGPLSVPWSITGLQVAVIFGLERAATSLLSSGCDAEQRDSWGQSGLHLATRYGRSSVVKSLLAHGAPVDGRTNDGETSLSYAMTHGRLEIANILIDHGADVNATDERRRSPLANAASRGDVAVVEYLLRLPGIQVDIMDAWKETPLWKAAKYNQWSVVEQLIAHGARLDAHNGHGMTIIGRAGANGQPEDIERLVGLGSHIDLVDSHGRTALSYAAELKQHSTTEYLLRVGADPRMADADGWTPLMFASYSGHSTGVNLLLQTDSATLRDRSRNGDTALSLASINGHKAVVELLLQYVEGSAVDMPNMMGRTSLMHAALSSGDVVTVLLDKAKAFIDVCRQDIDGKTAMHHAAAEGNVEAMLTLIAASPTAACNISDRWGRTPLWLACEKGHQAVVDALLSAEADTNTPDCGQKTPVEIAAENGHDMIVKTLLGLVLREWSRTVLARG